MPRNRLPSRGARLALEALLVALASTACPPLAAPLFAQEGLDSIPAPGWPPCRRTISGCVGKRAIATPLEAGDDVEVDGRLDEPVWRRAPAVSDFVQREPREGILPSERTEVRFAWDDRALYVAARMYRQDPSEIRATLARRDDNGNSERLIVSLDAYGDRRTAYTFAVTAAGGRLDWYTKGDEDDFRNRDFSYNPVWRAAARIDSLGWTAEMEIPFSQLRFNQRERQVWGLNLNRYLPDRNEDDFWISVPKNESGWTSWFGDLEGIAGVRSRRPVELVPYAAGSATLTSPELVDPDDPFRSETEWDGRAGADVKFGLGPSLTLDATFNPDFGQVEADPAEVNLSAFPTFFAERRPFFIERRELLEANGLFYSRRIGAPPQGRAEGDYVDPPTSTTILGAAKLTGRTPGGLSVGGLLALTGEESARVFDEESDATSRTRVEPVTGWGVVSLQQELGRSRSTVELGATAVRRDLSLSDPLAAQMNRQAYAGSLAGTWRLGDGAYEIRGRAAGSYVDGSEEAIARLQQFSSHYFQRPDADYVDYDPTRTSLSGWYGAAAVERTSARNWLWEAEVEFLSPGLDINDAGQLRRADRVEAEAQLRYRENVPGTFQSWSAEVETGGTWNFGWSRQAAWIDLRGDVRLRNFWGFNGEINVAPRSQSDVLTRGGPSMATPASWGVGGSVNSDYSRRTTYSAGFYTSRSELDGTFLNLYGSVESRPAGNWQLSLRPSFRAEREPRQYVRTVEGGGEATYGMRYVFAEIDRTTLSAQLRLQYAFTPDLSLEGYVEPFAATGTYDGYGELSAARSLDLRIYGENGTTIEETSGPAPHTITVTDGEDTFSFPRGDFRSISFRSNLVLRWEWRPGSTLYAIWQLDRGDFRSETDPSGADFGDLWSAPGEPGRSFFALKVSYWLPI